MSPDPNTTTGEAIKFISTIPKIDLTFGPSDKDRIRELEQKVEDLTRRVRDLEWHRG